MSVDKRAAKAKRKAYYERMHGQLLDTLIDIELRIRQSLFRYCAIKRKGPLRDRVAKTIHQLQADYQRALDEGLVYHVVQTQCDCGGKCQQNLRKAFEERFPCATAKLDLERSFQLQ